MANTKSAIKRIRQNKRHRERNQPVRSAIKGMTSKARAAIEAGDESAGQLYSDVSSLVDKAAKRGIIHANAANRHKARLALRMKKAAAK